MTIQEAQHAVDEWIKTIGVRYYNELTNMAILTDPLTQETSEASFGNCLRERPNYDIGLRQQTPANTLQRTDHSGRTFQTRGACISGQRLHRMIELASITGIPRGLLHDAGSLKNRPHPLTEG